jgi:hypothetical protein
MEKAVPRKKAEPKTEVVAVNAEAATQVLATDASLVERYYVLEDWLKAETKRFEDHVKGVQAAMDQIKQEFLRRLNERQADNTKTDFGTAYKTTLLNVSVSPEGASYCTDNGAFTGREALLEFALDNWNEWGDDMLQIGAQKDAVKRYMEDHKGEPPPGIKTAFFTKVNIKRA